MSARTVDLGLAAALIILGYTLLPDLETGDGDTQKVFCFSMQQEELDALNRSFLSRELSVDAFLYAKALRMLKRMLHGNTRRAKPTYLAA